MLDIANVQKGYLLFGGALTFIALSLDNFLRRQAHKNEKMMQDIKKWRKQSEDWTHYDRLKREDNKNATINVAIDRVIPSIKHDTLMIRVRQMPIGSGRMQWFSHVSGGGFTFTYRSKEVLAQLNDTKILSNILSESKEEVRLFGHMAPIVKRVTYYLRNGQSMAIVGLLSYDIGSKKFKIQPMVMGFSLQSIIDHFEDNYYKATVPRVATIIMAAIGMWLLYRPVKKILSHLLSKLPWRKRPQTEHEKQMTLLEHIKKKGEIKTRQQHVYECIKCSKNATCIIYKCGHLCLCEACHLKSKQQNGGTMTCPLCGKISKTEIKIFFG